MTIRMVIAGQGTLALEMLEDVPQLDALIVPVGGGGLISGCAIAAKAMKPGIEIFGAQSELYPAMVDAVKRHEPPPAPLRPDHRRRHRGQAAGPCSPPPSARSWCTDIFVVSEDAIEHALAMILEIEKTVIEGAAAAGFAALLAARGRFRAARSASSCRAAISTCGCSPT